MFKDYSQIIEYFVWHGNIWGNEGKGITNKVFQNWKNA